jgi:CCR4-NOT transcription complex subunit 3
LHHLTHKKVDEIRDGVEYYIDQNQDSDFQEDEELYDELVGKGELLSPREREIEETEEAPSKNDEGDGGGTASDTATITPTPLTKGAPSKESEPANVSSVQSTTNKTGSKESAQSAFSLSVCVCFFFKLFSTFLFCVGKDIDVSESAVVSKRNLAQVSSNL